MSTEIEVIECSLPIPDDVMDKYLGQVEGELSVFLDINLDASTFPTNVVLPYLKNVGVMYCKLTSTDNEVYYTLVDRYISSPAWLDLPCLTATVMLLLRHRLELKLEDDYVEYLRLMSPLSDEDIVGYFANDERKSRLDKMIYVLDSIPLLISLSGRSIYDNRFEQCAAVGIEVDDSDRGSERAFNALRREYCVRTGIEVNEDPLITGKTFVNLLSSEDFIAPFYAGKRVRVPTYYKFPYEASAYNGAGLTDIVSKTELGARLLAAFGE